MKRKFFTPSMGVACLALAVALSGTAYAVTRLPANSVGTKQVINGSLQRVDFKRGTLLRGPAGERGPQGPKGAAGPQGAGLTPGSVNIRSKGAEISPTAGVDTHVIMTCPEGTIGLYSGFTANVPVYVLADYGSGQDWYVTVRSTGATLTGGLPGSLYVYTNCVKTS
jgi:hypothetical protein